MRFIGSKEQLLPFIENAWRHYMGPGVFVVGDLFCGTAAVSGLFKRLGNRVVANDNLRLGYVFAQAALNISDEPVFARLFNAGEIPKNIAVSLYEARYDHVLAYLNELPGEEGFLFREYCPGGTHTGRFERRYFSDENARKIDAIRSRLALWRKEELLSEAELCLLLADLMRATNRVANIAGTYGCFIKHWDARAQKPISLLRSPIIPSVFAHEVLSADANAVARSHDFDVLYLDPPYTWRHYGAYYHILETIALGDEPAVSGRTGLRPWEDSRSRYCHRTDAVNALAELVACARARHLFLSYNDEGLISHDQIISILSTRGNPLCSEVGYRRYRSNHGGTKKNVLRERLYYVQTHDDSKGRKRNKGPILAHHAEQRSAQASR